MTDRLAQEGLSATAYQIDVDAFWDYVDAARYRERDYWRGGEMPLATEKWLEHFVSLELMQPQPGEVLVDIASCTSPFPEIVRERWKVEAYRQDWTYEDGVHDDRVGGDAADLPLPDEFADLMTLHCSFEHLEGDRDMGFLREAGRVLRPGGRLCILPFYTSTTYSIQTDIEAWTRREPELDAAATVCVADNWGEVHGRFYDPPRFRERILANLGPLHLEVFRVDNYQAVADDCYLKVAALFTKQPSSAT